MQEKNNKNLTKILSYGIRDSLRPFLDFLLKKYNEARITLNEEFEVRLSEYRCSFESNFDAADRLKYQLTKLQRCFVEYGQGGFGIIAGWNIINYDGGEVLYKIRFTLDFIDHFFNKHDLHYYGVEYI